MEIKLYKILFLLLLAPAVCTANPIWLGLASSGPSLPQCVIDDNCSYDDSPCKVLSIKGVFDTRWHDQDYTFDSNHEGIPKPRYTNYGLLSEIPDPSTGRITDLFIHNDLGLERNWAGHYNFKYNSTLPQVSENVPYGSWQDDLYSFQLRYDGTWPTQSGVILLYYWRGTQYVKNTGNGASNGFRGRYTTKFIAQLARFSYDNDWHIGDIANATGLPTNPSYGCGYQGDLSSNLYTADSGTFVTGTGDWIGTGGLLSNDNNGGCVALDNPVDCCTGDGAGTCSSGEGGGALKITRADTSNYNAAYVDLAGGMVLNDEGVPTEIEAGKWYRLFLSLRMDANNSRIKIDVNASQPMDVAERLSSLNIIHRELKEVIVEFEADGSDTLEITINTRVDRCTSNGVPEACCTGLDVGYCNSWSNLWIDNIELYQINP